MTQFEPGQTATIEVPFQLRRRGVEIRLVLRGEGAEAPDDKLAALVARSHRWLDQLTSGAIASIRGIAQAEGIDGGDVSRFLPLAFLAPEIVEALMNGRQGVETDGGEDATDLTDTMFMERAASSAELVTLALLFPHPEVESVLVIVVGRTGRPLQATLFSRQIAPPSGGERITGPWAPLLSRLSSTQKSRL